MKANIKLYQRHQLAAEPPLAVLVKLHQQGIIACQNKDPVLIEKVLILLNDKLDQTIWPDFSKQLSRHYSHLLACCHQGDYQQVENHLSQLMQKWQQQLVS